MIATIKVPMVYCIVELYPASEKPSDDRNFLATEKGLWHRGHKFVRQGVVLLDKLSNMNQRLPSYTAEWIPDASTEGVPVPSAAHACPMWFLWCTIIVLTLLPVAFFMLAP